MKTRNLLLALGCAAALTACTTNDEPNVAPAPAKKVVTLSVDVNEPADTRVEYEKVGTTYKFAWSEDDNLRVFYNDGSDEVYADFMIKDISEDGKKATFTSEDFPDDFEGPVTIVYASGNISFTDLGSGIMNGLEFSYEGNTSTTDVSADLAKRTLLYAKTIVQEAGTLPDVTLKHMFSYLLLKEGLEVVNVANPDVLTGDVTFKFGSSGRISFNTDGISPEGGYSVFNKVNIENNALKYDCLVPIFTGDDKLTDQLYIKVEYNGKSGGTSQPTFTYEPGKIYLVEATNEKWQPVTVAVPEEEVTPEVGMVIGANGNYYANAAAAEAAGTTAEAMIAYLGTEAGSPTGLAIALEDASENYVTWNNSGSNNGGKTAAELVEDWASTHAVTGGTWRLPSAYDWQRMFIGCGSSAEYVSELTADNDSMEFNSEDFCEKLNAAGVYSAGLGFLSIYYWSSTEYESADAWYYNLAVSSGIFMLSQKKSEYNIRAVLAF